MNSRLRRPAGALLATALAASILGAAPSAYAADGTISGTVTGLGGDLEGISVKAWVFEGGSWGYSDADGSFDSTDANGGYTLTLPEGPYRIGFDDSSGTHIEEFYNNAADVESASTVTVGGAPLDIDADLAEASHVTGTVTGPGDAPLELASVAAYKKFSDQGQTYWQAVEFADTDVFGNYDVGGLAAGTYRIGFDPDESGLAEEFYNDKAAVLLAQDITVGAIATVSGINAQLAEASQITGAVTDVNGAPMADVEVYARVVGTGEDWTLASSTTTNAAGGYVIDGLAKGTYRVEFEREVGNDFAYEAWNNKGRLEQGDDIVVGSNVTVSGKDAQLIVGEHDTKYLEGVTIPMISGTPQVGNTLSVTAGTWTPADITATYQWHNDDGAIAGATATTYAPTASDVGKTLVVLVDASKPGYENRTNMSNVVGPIVAAAPTPPVVAPAPVPAPAPAPAPVISFSKKIDVAGALTVGSTLKLKNFKALVSRAVVSYKIQWYAGSKKIKKATKSKLKVTKALKGKKIKVKVSATVGSTTKTVQVKVGKIR